MTSPELDSSTVHLLESVVSDFSDRCRRGENPSVEEYVARHPQLGDQLRDVLPAMRMLRRLTPRGSSRPATDCAVAMPDTIGDYQILSEIGRGGMGVVYHAVQRSLDRPVALKVLPHSAQPSDTSLERFRREAMIAAQLHHTNIVPVFGTGRAGDLHYFAMQFIDGESLDRILDAAREFEPQLDEAYRWKSPPADDGDRFRAAARRLLDGRLAEAASNSAADPGAVSGNSTTESAVDSSLSSTSAGTRTHGYCASVARIGFQVATALAHSHSHGILHRDIKPSNLILDHNGTIWVTDFGLARQDDQADLTSAGDLVGTLRYLAPERFRGLVDARSDVYALGLTLYELLTFRPPFAGKNRQQLIRAVLETEPPAPRTLRPGIPRDLETVVLKAIAKEPQLRYAKAQDLANDLRRFLDGRPVSARPLGSMGRAWRWCRRNPTVTTLAALLLAVLVSGLAVVTWQWRRAEASLALAVEAQREAASNLSEANRQRDRAEQNFLRARQAVDDYLTTISESNLLDVPTLEPLREKLLTRAKEFYEEFLENRSDNPQLQAELAATYVRLGQITHDLGGAWLPYFEQALAIVEQLPNRNANLAACPSWREGVYVSRAGWLQSDDPKQVLPFMQRAIEIWERLAEENPEVNGFRNDLASMCLVRGMIRLVGKQPKKALQDFEKSRELREELVERHPEVEKFRHGLGESYTMIGITHLQAGDHDEALRCTRRAKDLFDALTRANPSATRLLNLQAAVHQWISAALVAKGSPLEAFTEFGHTIKIQERLSREYPYVPEFQTNLATSYRTLGRSLFDAKQNALARATYDKCCDLLEKRINDYPREAEYRRALAASLVELSTRLERLQQLDDAAAYAERATKALLGKEPAGRSAAARAHFQLGRLHYVRNDNEAADEQFAQAVELEQGAPHSDATQLLAYVYYRGLASERLQCFEQAAANYREALELRQAQANPSKHDIATNLYRLSRVLAELDAWDEAERHGRKAVQQFRALGKGAAESADNAVRHLTLVLRRQGKHDEAHAVLSDRRAVESQRTGALFGADWSIAVYPVDESTELEGDELLAASLNGEPLNTLHAPAIDFIGHPQAPDPRLPEGPFAMSAEAELEIPAARYEIHLEGPWPARVLIAGGPVLELADNKADNAATAKFNSDGKPLPVRIELLQTAPLRSLRYWLRPLETPAPANDAP